MSSNLAQISDSFTTETQMTLQLPLG